MLVDAEVVVAPVAQCLEGLTIETIYLHQNTDLALLPAGYTHPCPDSINSHTCDRALFEVYGNEVYLGASRLNNGSGYGEQGPVTPSGERICKDWVNHPFMSNTAWTGSFQSRMSKITISAAQALSIASASAGGNQITFSLARGNRFIWPDFVR